MANTNSFVAQQDRFPIRYTIAFDLVALTSTNPSTRATEDRIRKIFQTDPIKVIYCEGYNV